MCPVVFQAGHQNVVFIHLKKKNRMRQQRRTNHKINSGTLADVAFLLLIFFMMATTLQRENILPMKLPPIQEGEPQQIADSKVLSIIINGQNEIRIEDKTLNTEISAAIETHLLSMIKKGVKPIINVKMHPKSDYQTYLTMLSWIKKGIRDTKLTMAKVMFPADFEKLSREQLSQITKKCGIKIMEQEMVL